MSRLVRCCVMLASAIALIAVMALGWRVDFATGQEEDAETIEREVKAILARCDGREASFQGGVRCRLCHTEPQNIEDDITEFVALTEATTWYDHDKHAKAYELIDPMRPENTLARQMCERLGIDPETFSEQQQCLSCHVNWVKGQARPDRFTAGVQCESCHGPSSLWDPEHTRPVWRTMTPAQKAQCGMVDVRSPDKRAEQCNSCHIGDLAQGKVVTHDMYAAGHPPLPSIEVESFAHQMPEHWKPISAKGDFLHREAYIRANYGEAAVMQGSAAEQRSRSVAIGAVVGLMGSVELVQQTAQQFTDGKGSWPELAIYDCSACHHDLQSPSWRQQRGYSGKPGRPALHQWPTALLPLALELVSATEEVRQQHESQWQDLQRAVQDAMDRQPFGKPAELATASKAMLEWLGQRLAELQQAPMEPERGRLALQRLTENAGQEILDWNSARQIGWATTVIYADFASDVPEQQDARIQTALSQLRQQLALDLPAGQQESILAQLPATLETLGNHDPEAVAETFAEIGRILSEL